MWVGDGIVDCWRRFWVWELYGYWELCGFYRYHCYQTDYQRHSDAYRRQTRSRSDVDLSKRSWRHRFSVSNSSQSRVLCIAGGGVSTSTHSVIGQWRFDGHLNEDTRSTEQLNWAHSCRVQTLGYCFIVQALFSSVYSQCSVVKRWLQLDDIPLYWLEDCDFVIPHTAVAQIDRTDTVLNSQNPSSR